MLKINANPGAIFFNFSTYCFKISEAKCQTKHVNGDCCVTPKEEIWQHKINI